MLEDITALRAENLALHAELSQLRAQLLACGFGEGSSRHQEQQQTQTQQQAQQHDQVQTVNEALRVKPQDRLPPACQQPATSSCLCGGLRTEHGLSKGQVERYSRQLLLPTFGVAAQGRLAAGSVLVVGCGGLGSPASLYLAAAGVGRLGLVDRDAVELSNLHRQVLHTEASVGTHKVDSAAAALRALNSGITLELEHSGLTPANAVSLVSRYDVVVDGSDNPTTRYLLNDAAVAARVPLVSAAAVGVEGQLSVYAPHLGGPCYRCVFPECPPANACARCADAGVLGPVPGALGVLQALEALKLLAGVGTPLLGKLLLFDGLAGRFSTVRLRGPAPSCTACGGGGGIPMESSAVAAYDYRAFTGQGADDGPPPPLELLPPEQRVRASELAKRLAPTNTSGVGAVQEAAAQCTPPVLLDVRPAEQFAVMALPGAVNLPYMQFDKRWDEVLQACSIAASDVGCVPGAAPVVVMCRRGNHSQLAVQRLREVGLRNVVDVIGGYEAWAAEVDGNMPTL